jgi:hypothetical protein
VAHQKASFRKQQGRIYRRDKAVWKGKLGSDGTGAGFAFISRTQRKKVEDYVKKKVIRGKVHHVIAASSQGIICISSSLLLALNNDLIMSPVKKS